MFSFLSSFHTVELLIGHPAPHTALWAVFVNTLDREVMCATSGPAHLRRQYRLPMCTFFSRLEPLMSCDPENHRLSIAELPLAEVFECFCGTPSRYGLTLNQLILLTLLCFSHCYNHLIRETECYSSYPSLLKKMRSYLPRGAWHNWLKVTETVTAEAGIKCRPGALWEEERQERREPQKSWQRPTQSDCCLRGATLEGGTQQSSCQKTLSQVLMHRMGLSTLKQDQGTTANVRLAKLIWNRVAPWAIVWQNRLLGSF